MADKVIKSKQVAKRKSPTSKVSSPVLTLSQPVAKREDRIGWYSLYIYAVCLVTLLTCLFSLVSVVRGIVDALWPDPGYFDPYSVPKDSALSADQIKENLTENNHCWTYLFYALAPCKTLKSALRKPLFKASLYSSFPVFR